LKKIILPVLFFLPLIGVAQLTIKVSSIPENTPMPSNIFIAGNFNNWNPSDDNFRLTNTGGGHYEITFTPNAGVLEFKFTRGSWATVEGTAGGTFIPNRQLNYSGGALSATFSIAGWEDNGGSGNSTASENVRILSDNFEMPQLNRTRRIWVYLPPDYETSDKTYPVLYMQDGQNLFDQTTSFAGEWEIDESLNTLFENGDQGIIVVGIDNGGTHRIDEYAPWVNPQYGGGEGDAYVNFIIETLKPYIDEHYHTKTDRINTGIMGSSLGGLISFYAAIRHQDIFGKAGIFSPSFWFSNEVYTLVEEEGKQSDMKIYLLAGEQESTTMVPNLITMKNTLLEVGFDTSEVRIITHPDGQHSEWYWAREFPDAYRWLFGDIANAARPQPVFQPIKIYPNPAKDTIYLTSNENLLGATAKIYSVDGKLLRETILTSDQKLSVRNLNSGIYILEISRQVRLLSTTLRIKI